MSDALDPYHKWLGIPPEEQPPDHYRRLGIARFESNSHVIASAAERQIAHVRSFLAGEHRAIAQRLVNELMLARAVLLEKKRKAAYDQQLQKNIDDKTPVDGQAQTAIPAEGILVASPVRAEETSHVTTARNAEVWTARPKRSRSPRYARKRRSSFVPVLLFVVAAAVTLVVVIWQIEQSAVSQYELTASDHRQTTDETTTEYHATDPGAAKSTDEKTLSKTKLPAKKPAESAPVTLFLDDLPEFSFHVGWGRVGRHGATGYPAGDFQQVIFRGEKPAHAISMHPPAASTSHVVFDLPDRYDRFTAIAGLRDRAPRRPKRSKAGSRLTFEVYGDNKLLWQSRKLQKLGDGQDCNVRIYGVRQLRLVVLCSGSSASAHAIWVNPQISNAPK